MKDEEKVQMEITNQQTSDEQSRGGSSPSGPKPTKIIVAVHGMGDQFRFATVQSVATRFCAFSKTPEALPFGRFYDKTTGDSPEMTYMLPVVIKNIGCDKDGNRNSESEVGFVEVYWADIPRIPHLLCSRRPRIYDNAVRVYGLK